MEGSNILDSKKHWVAIAGVCVTMAWAGALRAFTAAGGSSKPVPSASFAISCSRPVAPEREKLPAQGRNGKT